MNRRTFVTAGLVLAAGSAVLGPSAPVCAAGDGKIVALPRPDMNAGEPLFRCLSKRRTNRRIAGTELGLDTLGALLWAAAGVSSEDGKRTIPTARNRQEILVHVVRGDGVWEYLPTQHAIKRVIDGDQRRRFDGSGCIFLYSAPADDIFGAAHAGSAYQDVGLACASMGLANCVKYQKHDALSKELPLPSGWRVVITQSVGLPADR